MSLVLDCSATLAWLYPDETTQAIRQVFARIAAEGCIVPSLWRLEVANGLTIAVRRRRISAGFRMDALNALALEAIEIDTETSAYAWGTTLHLADRFDLTVYDASYLELAQRRSLSLASLDVRLCEAARALGVSVIGD